MKKILLILLLSTPLLAQSWLSTDLWKLSGTTLVPNLSSYTMGLSPTNYFRVDSGQLQFTNDGTNWTAIPSSLGWTLGASKVFPTTAGNKVHIRTSAGDTTGTALLNVYGTSYFNGNATFAGSVSATNLTLTGIVTTTSVSYSVTAIDAFIKANATSNAITVNLPAVSTSTGREITIKKIDSSANIVTLDANGSETIDGSTTKTITLQYESATIVCDGTSWLIK